MDIIVSGIGMVGRSICASLVKEKHNVTVIDIDENALRDLSDNLDVQTIKGSGSDISSLRKAGCSKAELVVAVAGSDETNILTCAAASKLGAKRTIARVRDPGLVELTDYMKDEIGLSVTINPELTAAKEIYRMLRFPSAAKVDTFCKGRVELAQYIIPENTFLCGKSLNELRTKMNFGFLVCAVQRGDEVIIPGGRFVLGAGDRICITAGEEELAAFFKTIGAYTEPVGNVLITGGGRVTYYLESFLANSDISSTVIERDKALCYSLATQYDCTTICDNPTKQELLIGEGIKTTDAFLALSAVDEENAIVSMFAKTENVKKVITLISTLSYVDFFKSAGIDSIVSPKSSMASFVLRYARAMVTNADSEMESLHRIMDGRVEAIEFIVKDDIQNLTSKPLKEIRLRFGVLVVCIVRKDKVMIPTGSDTIEPGDTVVIVSDRGRTATLKDILA